MLALANVILLSFKIEFILSWTSFIVGTLTTANSTFFVSYWIISFTSSASLPISYTDTLIFNVASKLFFEFISFKILTLSSLLTSPTTSKPLEV